MLATSAAALRAAAPAPAAPAPRATTSPGLGARAATSKWWARRASSRIRMGRLTADVLVLDREGGRCVHLQQPWLQALLHQEVQPKQLIRRSPRAAALGTQRGRGSSKRSRRPAPMRSVVVGSQRCWDVKRRPNPSPSYAPCYNSSPWGWRLRGGGVGEERGGEGEGCRGVLCPQSACPPCASLPPCPRPGAPFPQVPHHSVVRVAPHVLPQHVQAPHIAIHVLRARHDVVASVQDPPRAHVTRQSKSDPKP